MRLKRLLRPMFSKNFTQLQYQAKYYKCTQPMICRGGASRDRTDDPLLAKQVLSQLSYGPMNSGIGIRKIPPT